MLNRLRPTKLFFGLYFALIALVFLYSFTQIDLGLTMTRVSLFTTIQKSFQYIGYFNRPLSSLLFILLVSGMMIFYLLFLLFAKRGLIAKKTAWIVIFVVTILLVFSYNAFSYDIFNYIFDAKIFTQYHLNPYLFKALDFPQDPMLAFMHWTQRTYPYGPFWLVLTIPLSYAGLQFFLPTFFLFKILAAVCFIGTAYFIGKIVHTISPEEEVFGILFFALNPLVIVESLISGHNDIAMMFFAILSLYLILEKKYLFAFVLLFFSAGIKYATGLLLPLYAVIFFFQKKKSIFAWQPVIATFVVAMILAVVAASLRTNFQPWYLLFVFPFAALIARKFFIFVPVMIMTVAALLNYLPFLYTGNWNPPIPTLLNWMIVAGVVLSLVYVLFKSFASRSSHPL